jgi:hypothetical protein
MSAELDTTGEPVLVGPITGDEAETLWPMAMKLLEPAIEREGKNVSEASLYQDLALGKMGLFLVRDDAAHDILAVILCEVIDFPNVSIFSFAYLAGKDHERWKHLIAHFESIARQRGCTRLRIPGRPGWQRVYPEFTERYRVLEKEIA